MDEQSVQELRQAWTEWSDLLRRALMARVPMAQLNGLTPRKDASAGQVRKMLGKFKSVVEEAEARNA